ncbi:arylsulfatase A-like enzyme [Tahibacter aquaticus]|uniref:Arylsulfatase A-like enzyme n=1 Tax=Tahibacter aquaticus TaxID=520092 RepID=A0A4R6Z057_9GAMM|nr:sulfatase-like hydrolase/transferase [Tahibacter aquaticus]TDR44891.1 arylsulfatase A-like enzyme [Tahibacter aquaticus]
MRSPLSAACLLACLLAAGGCGRNGPPPLLDLAPGSARGANVVLITLDTVRADRLGCSGHTPSVTPTLDRICADGIRFANAVTPAPITLPAHASLLRGLDPPHHGLRYNAEFPQAGGQPSLAGDLRQAGYRTAAVVASFVLDRRFGLSQGFDDYDDRVDSQRQHGGATLRNERDAEAVTDAALALLQRDGDTRPLFLWVHYYDAHAPYAPLQPIASTDPQALYTAEIAQVDAAIGRLLQSPALAAERTVLIVAADHGESLGEHGEVAHGLFLYDSTTHIPLLLRLPRRELAGSVVTGLAGLVDVRASVNSLLGLAPPARSDGIDWLATSRSAGQGLYQEAALPYFDFGFAPLYAWRGATERFVEAPQPEYYDLAADPQERHNRYAAAQSGADSRAERARQRLDALRLDAPAIPAAASALEQADPAVTARLRSLGYLGSSTASAELADPKSQIAVVNLHSDAVHQLDAGNAAAALALLDQARALSPRNEAVLRLSAKAELQLDRLDAAEVTLKAILAIRQNADSLLLLAQIRVLRGDFDTAATLLQQAEQSEPQHGGIAIARGDIALREGDVEAARREYERAAQIDPARTGDIARQRLRPLATAPKP